MAYLPLCEKDKKERGIQELDVVLVTGDAYVDHPSFGAALIGRHMERFGYTVGIIPQPRSVAAYQALGTPRLGFFVTAGNLDSMVCHYTVAKNKRDRDVYSPGSKKGLRPDRALLAYTKTLRELFPSTPIVIGGLEASLRRFAHYDYWADRVLPSLLVESSADLLIYGQGERAVIEVLEALDSGLSVCDISFVAGTSYKASSLNHLVAPTMLPSFSAILEDKKVYAESFLLQMRTRPEGPSLVETYGSTEYVIQNPPQRPLTTEELDQIYEMPFTRTYHPKYAEEGGVPALGEVQFSLTSTRGCMGGCSFCSLAFHQGRTVVSRSKKSLLREAKSFLSHRDFKGIISDVGGATANFYGLTPCTSEKEECMRHSCLGENPCKKLKADHGRFLSLLKELREIPGVKQVFVRSGIRFDYLLLDTKRDKIIKELCKHHISGQIRVAPEHMDTKVLSLMGKGDPRVFHRFLKTYKRIAEALGKNQYVIPYFISSHPGSNLKSAILLAEYIKESRSIPEQVQDFYPTPGTLSTCMFYTGFNPLTGSKVYVPKDPEEKAMQRALLQFHLPQNYDRVKEALKQAKRPDLMGYGKKCLISHHPKDPAKKPKKK